MSTEPLTGPAYTTLWMFFILTNNNNTLQFILKVKIIMLFVDRVTITLGQKNVCPFPLKLGHFREW